MKPGIASFIFGEALEFALPERIRAAIALQQIRSEILIGWVQLVWVSLLAVLYVVAPKTSLGTDFMPVPWVLGAYLAFTLGRLALAHRRGLPGWLVMISIVADAAMLMGLIWSFHLQYHQPAPFYLKAPTMLYVFILIALRALRFEPRYVIAAGGAAALGWLALLVYALSEQGMGMITRDYVHYMTSNAVLIGAEIDKIISILVVTAVLAVALVRAQRLLRRAVVDSLAAKDLARFVPQEVAARVVTAEREMQPGDGEVRVATVMFTDIEGFSTIAERLTPRALMGALNDYFALLSEIVGRFGGMITQINGDALLIGFNTARPDPDHAANAVRAALAIQEALATRTFADAPFRTRCGINTGEMIAGAVGSRDRLLFTVHGDEVNIAARLEPLNKQHGTYVLVGERTAAEAGGAFTFRRVAEVTVRGRSQPTVVYGCAGPATAP